MPAYALFETPLGNYGMLWHKTYLLRIQMPEADDDETIIRLLQHAPDAFPLAPSALIQSYIKQIIHYLEGNPHDFSQIQLDFSRVTPFCKNVYLATQCIPYGQTVTYQELAGAAHSPKAARGVGQALAKNLFPLVVPCHRVLSAGGKAGGFSAYGGLALKAKLLRLEGVILPR